MKGRTGAKKVKKGKIRERKGKKERKKERKKKRKEEEEEEEEEAKERPNRRKNGSFEGEQSDCLQSPYVSKFAAWSKTIAEARCTDLQHRPAQEWQI